MWAIEAMRVMGRSCRGAGGDFSGDSIGDCSRSLKTLKHVIDPSFIPN